MSPQYLGLHLATATMCQPTVDTNKTVYVSEEMWQICPGGRGPVSQWRDLEQKEKHRNMRESCGGKGNWKWKITRDCSDQHTCRTEMYIQKSYFFCPLFLLFSSPWPFSSFITPPNRGVIFLFPTVSTLQHPSQGQVLLSHYLIIGAMEEHLFRLWHSERPVTFTEAQLCGFADVFQLNKEAAPKGRLTGEQDECLNFQKPQTLGVSVQICSLKTHSTTAESSINVECKGWW